MGEQATPGIDSVALGRIDWSAPWLACHRAAGERVCARIRSGLGVAAALSAECDMLATDAAPRLAAGPLRFVEQGMLPRATAYETFIAATAQVPTRDNLHDLFNGLAWLAWPQLKRRLNELQAAQIEVRGIGPTRGRLRDALTLFDENAALLRLPRRLEQALRARDWYALFVTHRADWHGARVDLFGHALLEKLCVPRKAITAHGWLLPHDLDDRQADTWLGAMLDDERLADRHPLPVLGVPGWWPESNCAAFYADPAVFRPLR